MELTKSEFMDFVEDVLEIMYKMADPYADAAVAQLDADLSDRDKDALANAAYFRFEEYCRGR